MLVETNLGRLHNNVSPGDDGMGARLCKAFPELFCPRMFSIAEEVFSTRQIYLDWVRVRTAEVTKLRPIALQDVEKKWLINIVCMSVEQIFQHLTHRRQVGRVKGRQMIHHVWGVRSGYEHMQTGALISFDSSNAFPTLTHEFIFATLHLIELPETMIAFIPSTLITPYHLCVGRGVVREVVFFQESVIG